MSLDTLPDTLADRSIVIEMRRKHVGELVERARPSELIARFKGFRPRLQRWAADHIDALRRVRPLMPEELGDRGQDCWEALFAIADVIGGGWTTRARSAAIQLLGERDEEDVAGVMLLTDIRAAFDKNYADRLTTSSILIELTQMEERPWPTWGRGRAVSARQLAKLLKPFGIKPGTIRVSDNSTPKGYMREWFRDAWDRYLDNQERWFPGSPR